MGILKLTKGELKKIFLKPGIFVITALLVAALAISCFMFNPKTRDDDLVYVNGNTITQMYDASFGSSQTNHMLSKENLTEKYINSSQQIIKFYENEIQNNTNTKKDELYNAIEIFYNHYCVEVSSYKALINSDAVSNVIKNEKRDQIKQDIQNFSHLYVDAMSGINGFYYLLLDSNAKTELDVFLATCLSSPFGDNIEHTATANKLEELDVFNVLKKYVDEMQTFIPTIDSINEAKQYMQLGLEKLSEIETDLNELKTNYPSDNSIEKKKEFRTLLTRYKQASINIYDLTLLTINKSALDNFTDSQIQSFYQFKDNELKTKYAIQEQKTICKFYLDTNKYAFEYANPLNLSKTSNVETNVYDFMYFALEICSFIIIVYIVYLGATMIAGEYASGTMKLLAIRPYSRNKILFSKLLSTIIVGLIFLIVTFIVTFIMGGILFGTTSLNILLIFNSTTISSVSPIVMILILFLCKIVELTFYAILSLSISTLFKSNAGSIVISILIYFISFVLTMFTSILGIFKYLPFVNTNLFGYFGSHILTSSNNIVANMFSKVIANDMNFYVSFAIITFFSVIIYTITSIVFRKRDIK